MTDLSRREADLGIRTSRSASPVLVERAAGQLRFAPYASQSYVDRRLRDGRLLTTDFARHDFVGYAGTLARAPQMAWLTAHGAVRFPFRTNSDIAMQEAVEQGQGIALLAEAHARTAPELIRLDFDGSLPAVPIFLVFHKDLRRVPRVRLVVEALESALRQALA